MFKEEDSAGGISYRTMKGINVTQIRKYLDGRNQMASQEILEKNKEYYKASADKIITRLELAQIRVKNIDVDKKDLEILNERLLHGLKWLEFLKKQIKKAKDNAEFQKAVSYKKWHAVKLIPSAAEGYALNASLEKEVKEASINSSHEKVVEKAKIHLEKAEKIFFDLLNLGEDTDFKAAEKARIEAYKEIGMVLELLKKFGLELA